MNSLEFGERLHLDESAAVYYIPQIGVETSFQEDTWSRLSMEDEVVIGFISALFDGEFLEQEDEKYTELESSVAYPLAFIDSRGLITEIMIYKEGYVTVENSENTEFLIKLDDKQCQNMIKVME